MKFILLPGLLLAFMACFFSNHANAQVTKPFTVYGTLDKFYPVVFTDSAWWRHEASEIQIGRSDVHRDSSWRGSLIAKFRYHTTNWGNGSSFIDADIHQYSSVPDNSKFIAGWRDATANNSAFIIIIWLRGNTSYYFSSRYNDRVTVYDGVTNPLPFEEPVINVPGTTSRPQTFKTSIDSYVNTNGSTFGSSTAYYNSSGTNFFGGNVGLGTTSPTAKLEIGGGPAWTSAGWGKAIKLWRAQSMVLDAGSKKFGIGASFDSLFYFFSADTDSGLAPIRWNMVMTGSGNIGIGTQTPNAYKLAVEGTLGARRIKVTQQANWADHVFHPGYKLPTLQEVAQFIQTNGHLPEIPTAAEVKENGVDVGEMNRLLLQKVEELTLYLIKQQKEIDELKSQIKK